MSKYKKIEVTPRRLQEIKNDVTGQTLILVLGYLMDDMEYDPDNLLGVLKLLVSSIVIIA